MSWLTDNPAPLLALGLLAQIMLGMILWQTRQAWVAVLMIALALANAAAVAFEILYISPTEEITARIDEIARLVETNDHDRVLDCIAPEALQSRAEALAELKQVKVAEASVAGDLRITLEAPADPARPEAMATFIGRVKLQMTRNPLPHDVVIQRLRVWFRKQDGQWLVTRFELLPYRASDPHS